MTRVGLFEFTHGSKKWNLPSEIGTYAKSIKPMSKLTCKSQNQKLITH